MTSKAFKAGHADYLLKRACKNPYPPFTRRSQDYLNGYMYETTREDNNNDKANK
jgi:hypothetical protein